MTKSNQVKAPNYNIELTYLNDHAPYDFAEQWIARSTAAACTAGPPAASGAVHDAHNGFE